MATDSSAASGPSTGTPTATSGTDSAKTARSEIGIAAAKTRNGDGPR